QAKPSLAIAGADIGRIEKHAAARQDAKRFRNQRTDPTHVEIRLTASAGAGETFIDVGANRPMPVPSIGRVDGELRGIACDLNRLPDQQKLPRAPVKNEDIDTRVERENERGLRTVDNETRSALRCAGLKEGRKDVVASRADRKNRTHRDVVFEIGRS